MIWPETIVLALAIRTVVACAFVASAIGQLRDLPAFAGVVANYRVLPSALAPAAARGLPFALLATAAGVLAWPGPAAGVAILLLLGFAGAMALNLKRGRRDIDCGCHQGAPAQPIRTILVVRNIGLCAALAAAAPAPALGQPMTTGLGLAAGAAGFCLYLAANALWALGPPPPRRTIRIAKVTA